MLKFASLAALAVAAQGHVYFKETFENMDAWVNGKDTGKVGLASGEFFGPSSNGLQTQQDAKFYHVSAAHEAFSNAGKELVLQFSVKHQQNIDCGGGYLKYMKAGTDQKNFNGDSEYNIMFGPDICGATKKVHVIFNYNGKNHLIKDTIPAKTDTLSHVYTLVVKPDQTFEVLIDGDSAKKGSLTENWDLLEPKTIKDPAVSKPTDWVDEAQIDDSEDVKPDGYDDIPASIVDPDATKPEDWDDEDDGEWEAPTISNPAFKGPWKAKRIANPDYKGVWVHPEIANPDYKFDENIYSYDSFGVVGLDVWQVKSGSIFDNIIITDSQEEARAFLEETWTKDHAAEKAAKDAKDAADRKAADEARAAEESLKSVEEDEDEEEGHDEL